MWPSERRGSWRVTSGEDSQEWLSHMIAGIEGRELTVENSNFLPKPQKGWATRRCLWGSRGRHPPVANKCLAGSPGSDCAHTVQNGTVLRLVFAVLYQNEEERPDGKTVVLCALSYVRCCSWGALFAAFRRPAHRTTPRPEAFRGRSDRDEKEFPWSWATISPLPPTIRRYRPIHDELGGGA